MPHQCTGCGHVFPDGSKEMLSGCPECGGNKFQFQPAGSDDPAPEPDDEPEPPEPPTENSTVADAVAGATERVRDLVGSEEGDWPAVGREGADGTPAARSTRDDAGGAPTAGEVGDEDTAQASARSSVVDPEDLPEPADSAAIQDDAPSPAPEQPPAADEPTADAGTEDPEAESPFTGSGDDDGPDLADLREELNDQFESIRIVDRGQYELNLMELYDREEYIISLMEDGRYAIEVPEAWRDE